MAGRRVQDMALHWCVESALHIVDRPHTIAALPYPIPARKCEIDRRQRCRRHEPVRLQIIWPRTKVDCPMDIIAPIDTEIDGFENVDLTEPAHVP